MSLNSIYTLCVKTKNSIVNKWNAFWSRPTWDKLKREWYTFAIALVALMIYIYDAIVAAGLDITKLVPEAYQNTFGISTLVLMLLLRRYVPSDIPEKDTNDVS